METTDSFSPAKSPVSGALHSQGHDHRSGVALVLVLAFIVLLAGIVVAILTMAGTERTSAGLTLQRTQAGLLADATADSVMGTITDTVTKGSQPGTSWASEPGRLWIFNFDSAGTITRKSVDLFSGLPKADPDNCDLNAPSVTGEFPIAPPAKDQTVANMKVGWKYFLRDPGAPSTTKAEDNPAVARVAYWVDDESCKVNINTADGSLRSNSMPTQLEIRTNNSNQNYTYGFGTPSEISLAALPGLDNSLAKAIAAYPWKQEFNSAEEITRVKNTTGTASLVTRDMYKALRFDITHFNSSPDVNFMGQPRISLVPPPVVETGETPDTARQLLSLGPLQKPAAQLGVEYATPMGAPLDFVYPQPSQLPLPSYLGGQTQFFLHTYSNGGQKLVAPMNDYYVGQVISKFFSNVDMAGQTFVWPKFEGVTSTTGFLGKYTARQLDSITLQILDVPKTTFIDQNRPYSFPGYVPNGWLSNQPVIGVARAHKVNEILITGTLAKGSKAVLPYGKKSPQDIIQYKFPNLSFGMTVEFYFPAGYLGTPQNPPFDGASQQWRWYPADTSIVGSNLNFYDYPPINPGTSEVAATSTTPLIPATPGTGPTGPSRFGSVWMDKMITTVDQSNNPAGIDLLGNSRSWKDPDQQSAKNYHPYSIDTTSDSKTYNGSVDLDSKVPYSIVEMTTAPINSLVDRAAGCYHTLRTRWPTTPHPGNSNTEATTTSIRIKGSLLFSTRNESDVSGIRAPILAPLDGMVPEWTKANVSYNAEDAAKIIAACIPLDLKIDYPGTTQLLLRVADPLVNQLPGDWQPVTNPLANDITLYTGASSAPSVYLKGGYQALDPYFTYQPAVGTNPNPTLHPTANNGDNPGFRPSGGGDPLSIWLPNQDIRIPKQARFPSVGALFSVRTGVFPDLAVTSLPIPEQHGTPFRALNMAPSTQLSQQTVGGRSYPDWAMLDLFTVPYLPQKPYMKGDTVTPIRRLTYGGATIGRMNINNPVIPYPFSATPAINQLPPKRNALKALFQGLRPSTSYRAPSTDTKDSVDDESQIYTTIDADKSDAIAQAITDYQATSGPFFMTGQIANVPAVAAYLYQGGNNSSTFNTAAISRNDVVRDTIGAITTRSNVYSVWVVAQTFKKKSSSKKYDSFETGDVVTGEVRRHYLVERFIDAGKDGVPGNVVKASAANNPNAFTLAKPTGDIVDVSYHPALTYPLPYRWRVVAVETFQL